MESKWVASDCVKEFFSFNYIIHVVLNLKENNNEIDFNYNINIES